LALDLLEQVKRYLRIDGGEDDDVLALLINDAKGYLADAGVLEIAEPDSSEDPERAERIRRYLDSYKLAIMQYVAAKYENREAIGGRLEVFSLGFASRIPQLQLECRALMGGEMT